MANVMPPGDRVHHGLVAAEKAGVGSAINNTVRQVGALGIAVLGSVLPASTAPASAISSVSCRPVSVPPSATRSPDLRRRGCRTGQPAAAGRLVDAGNSAFIAVHWAAWGSNGRGVIGVVVCRLVAGPVRADRRAGQ
jgi:hypothetical protein